MVCFPSITSPPFLMKAFERGLSEAFLALFSTRYRKVIVRRQWSAGGAFSRSVRETFKPNYVLTLDVWIECTEMRLILCKSC